jgi:signal peptidase I
MSLPWIGIIILDVWLLWMIGKWVYHTFFLDKGGKKRLLVSKMLHQFKHKRQWDRDELSEEQLTELAALTTEAEELLKEKAGVRKIEKWMKESGKRWHGLLKHKSGHAARETVEVLIVVIGVVMGLRGLYLQPFKIPTGSMQPTLFGIHFEHDSDAEVPAWPMRVLDGVNYSRRYVDVTAAEDCQIVGMGEKKRLPVVGFFLPQCVIETSDGRNHVVPGKKVNVFQYLQQEYGRQYPEIGDHRRFQGPFEYKAGDAIARGYFQLGDHLFVDRVSYHFREPERGDIVVFITDGVVERGYKMSGRYYIKRLVGLPGEKLQIRDRRLYVMEPGQTEFRLVGDADHPAFERIYSMKGGNRGYSHIGDEDEIFELGPDEYFMMGDNSENSQDSRYWGIVKRDEIVGRAFVVYWPFLRRWPLPDRMPALDFPSTPTR